jgi:hypothetical protein
MRPPVVFDNIPMPSAPMGRNAHTLADEVSSAGVFCVLHTHMAAKHRWEI